MPLRDAEDRWEPWPWQHPDALMAGPESTVCDPPEGMPEARPVAGFCGLLGDD